jgi:hypothetical protein
MINLAYIAQDIVTAIADEWNAQGHDLNGSFRDGMRYRITEENDVAKIEIIDTTDSSYGKILNEGVTAQQIRSPFAPARIRGLTMYAKLRMGASDKDAVSIAYAIASKHAKEGMPTPSSRQYSSTGNRTHFVEDAQKKITEILNKGLKEAITWPSL